MKAKQNSATKVTFTGIANESQLEQVTNPAERAKCEYEQSDFSTKVVVTGTEAQIKKFIKLYNS